MNIIVSNAQSTALNNLDIDIIKNINGTYDANELVAMFKALFFNKLILYDVKNIRDCSEKTIVDFYIETAYELITAGMVIDENFYETLKIISRNKLVNKYTNKNCSEYRPKPH